MIQGFRSNPKDPESHILFFDIEALIGSNIFCFVYNICNKSIDAFLFFFYIVQLLSDEYGAMSPGSLEAHGLISTSEYQKVAALTQSASPDAHKIISG